MSAAASPDASNTHADHGEDGAEAVAGWGLLVFFGVLFTLLAFLFIRSIDDDGDGGSGGDDDVAAVADEGSPDALRAEAEASGVRLGMSDGDVIAFGTVADEAERDAVLARLRAAAEGRTVVDRLVVADATTDGDAASGGDDADAGGAGDDEVAAEEEVAEPRSEADILAEVRALYDEFGIDGEPSIVDGILFLDGVALDQESKSAIAGVVRRIEGVDRSRNRISVVPPPAEVTDLTTAVEVEGGQVTLTGAVATEEARAALVAAAGEVFGAGSVVDELVVDPNADGRIVVTGTIDERLREQLAEGLGSVAEATGAELDDRATYVALSDEQADLQAQINDATADLVINFGSGSSVLVAAERAKLDPLAAVLADVDGVVVAIEGFTDDRGDAAANQILSQERADAVRDYLVAAGVAPEVLIAVGNGESQPIADNSTSAGRAANRRTEFEVRV